MRVWWGLRIEGEEHVPAEGAAIITPNHKSFFDSFFLAAATKRPLRFMGKSELFEGRKGKLLVRLGAFPVLRGQSDAEALETARIILEQGELLSLFPEGTRVSDPDELGAPKRGAVRLALETGAPLIPAAITGTEKLFAGPLPRPRTVRVAFGEPVQVDEVPATPEAAGEPSRRRALAEGLRRVLAPSCTPWPDRRGPGGGRHRRGRGRAPPPRQGE